MRITMVNAPLLPVPPVLGGPIERTLYETARTIRDPKSRVISLWAKELADCSDMDRKIFFHVNIKKEERHVSRVLNGRIPPELQNRRRARNFYYFNGVSDLLEEHDPDVIQVHNDTHAMAYLAKQFPEKAKILYMHNEARFGDPKTVEGVRASDHLIFVSHYLAGRFWSHFPECISRSTVIYNSVDVSAFHPDLQSHREAQKIQKTFDLQPGRTVPVKGLHCLLDSFFKVKDALSDVKLLIVGSPLFGAVSKSGYLRRLQRRAKVLGDAVSFTGFIDPDHLPYYYAAADVAVVPSMWGEPFGKVVAEAMASGVPVVGSRRGAIPELVEDNVMGKLVDNPENVDVLAQAIIDLLEDNDLRKDMGAVARFKAEREFATGVRLQRLRKFYKGLEATG